MVRNKPAAKIVTMRLKILRRELPFISLPYFFSEYHVDIPTIKRKKGKTRSVGVQPFHFECCKGWYTKSQLPGLLTIIIKATVNPLKISRETNLPLLFAIKKTRYYLVKIIIKADLLCFLLISLIYADS